MKKRKTEKMLLYLKVKRRRRRRRIIVNWIVKQIQNERQDKINEKRGKKLSKNEEIIDS